MADSSSGDDQPKRLEVSKYPNRRYYDKTNSRHLTLQELYEAIRDGYDVKVTDSKTGTDITPNVLAQMILELDSVKLGVFPVELLHRLLRGNQQLVLDFTKKYFSSALMAFLDSQKKTEQILRQTMGLEGTPPVADWAKLMLAPLTPGAWQNRPAAATEGEVEQLRQEIKKLQDSLAQTKSRKPKSPRKKSSK